jgi:hypothetical protein
MLWRSFSAYAATGKSKAMAREKVGRAGERALMGFMGLLRSNLVEKQTEGVHHA